MDSLTQIVLGAAVGEAVLGKKVGNKAILWGAIAGTIPDLDVLVKFFTDDISANEMHRGFSHSIVFCVLMAPILGYLISKIYHRNMEASMKDWSRLSFWSLITHPLLDAHTTWGTQLFWPFDLRVAYKNINVVDPLYTLPFLLLVLAAMFFNRRSKTRRILNWLGISLSSLYMVYTIGIKFHVNGIFKDNLANQHIDYIRYTSQPTIFNSILWTAIAETDDAYYMGYYSLMDEDQDISYIKYEKNILLRNKLSKNELIQRLVKLSDGWFLLYQTDRGYDLKDLRFGQSSFTQAPETIIFTYHISEYHGKLLGEQQDPPRDKIGEMFTNLMNRVKGFK